MVHIQNALAMLCPAAELTCVPAAIELRLCALAMRQVLHKLASIRGPVAALPLALDVGRARVELVNPVGGCILAPGSESST